MDNGVVIGGGGEVEEGMERYMVMEKVQRKRKKKPTLKKQ